MVFEVEARVVPSGAVDRTLSVYDGSANRSDAIKVTTLPYPLGYKLTFSMWSISDGDGTDMIINVLGKVETVHVEPYWTRCEILIEEPVGRDILITPIGPTKFWLYKAQLELGEAASDWVPSPDEFYAGSVISMNEHEVYIGTEVFEVDIANGAELLHIDEDGVVTNNMTVNNKIVAPNIAEKYTGASSVTLGDGSSGGNITLYPQQFSIVYPDHVLEGNGSGGVVVNENSYWDMYRYAFTRRSSIIPRRIVDNAALHVLSMGYEVNSTYLPLTTGELDSTIQADALIINCQKTETTTGGEFTVGPLAFTTRVENKALMSNGSTAYTIDNDQWDIWKLVFSQTTHLVFTNLVKTSLEGVTVLAVERDGAFFTVDTPEISQKTVFDADALLINYSKMNSDYSIRSVTYVTDPTIVTSRQFSIESFEYTDGSSDVGVSSYKTISDFANAVSNRVLANDLVVNMNSDIYGGSWIGGISGIGGITINGNGTGKNTMNSNLSFYNMNVPITFNRVTFNGSIGLNACKYVAFNNCVLNGNGGSVALYLGKGTTCSISGGGLYNAGVLVAADTGAKLLTEAIGGKGSTTAFLRADKSIILMNGTRPLGNVNLTSCLTSPADISQMETYEGSANPEHEDASIDLTPIAASSSRTYYEGTWYSSSDSNVRQGFMDMGNGGKVQSGCMWFPTSSLSSVSIKSASLTLTRVSGKGTSADVEVDLWGITITGPGEGQYATEGAVSYGKIGTIGNGETKELLIPLTAINALKSGSTIKGFMLQVSDHTLKNGKGYSTNYAVFYGAGTNYAPVLKIVGQ